MTPPPRAGEPHLEPEPGVLGFLEPEPLEKKNQEPEPELEPEALGKKSGARAAKKLAGSSALR